VRSTHIPHPIVIHTYPHLQDKVYVPLLGAQSGLSGISLQNHWRTAHQRVLKWITESEKAGRPWVVANDEQNPHFTGVPPDPGYEGHDGVARPGKIYVVYLPDGGTTALDLGPAKAEYSVRWYDPRNGGPLLPGTVTSVSGPGVATLGQPPRDPGDDWVILVRRRGEDTE